MYKNLLLSAGIALLSLNVFASSQAADTVAPETATAYKQVLLLINIWSRLQTRLLLKQGIKS